MSETPINFVFAVNAWPMRVDYPAPQDTRSSLSSVLNLQVWQYDAASRFEREARQRSPLALQRSVRLADRLPSAQGSGFHLAHRYAPALESGEIDRVPPAIDYWRRRYKFAVPFLCAAAALPQDRLRSPPDRRADAENSLRCLQRVTEQQRAIFWNLQRLNICKELCL